MLIPAKLQEHFHCFNTKKAEGYDESLLQLVVESKPPLRTVFVKTSSNALWKRVNFSRNVCIEAAKKAERLDYVDMVSFPICVYDT